MYCFEKKGVLLNENDDESVIEFLTQDLFDKYILDGIVKGGMIPKLENSFEALKSGVKQVVITRSDQIHLDAGTKMML